MKSKKGCPVSLDFLIRMHSMEVPSQLSTQCNSMICGAARLKPDKNATFSPAFPRMTSFFILGVLKDLFLMSLSMFLSMTPCCFVPPQALLAAANCDVQPAASIAAPPLCLPCSVPEVPRWRWNMLEENFYTDQTIIFP